MSHEYTKSSILWLPQAPEHGIQFRDDLIDILPALVRASDFAHGISESLPCLERRPSVHQVPPRAPQNTSLLFGSYKPPNAMHRSPHVTCAHHSIAGGSLPRLSRHKETSSLRPQRRHRSRTESDARAAAAGFPHHAGPHVVVSRWWIPRGPHTCVAISIQVKYI